MSLKIKYFAGAVALSVGVLGFSVAASAQETTEPKGEKVWKKDGNGKHGGRRGGFIRGLHGIELTDAQKEQLRAIHENNKPDRETMDELRTMRKARRNGTLTEAQIERFKALKTQMREKGKLVHEQVLAILTPEQREQLEKRKEEMKEKREKFRELRKNKTTEAPKPLEN